MQEEKMFRSMLLAGLVLSLQPLAACAQFKTSAEVVKAKAAASKVDADGNQVITVTLTVDKGWHLYANPVNNEAFEPNATEVTVSGKVKPVSVKAVYPKGQLQKDKDVGDMSIYTGTVSIKVNVKRAKGDKAPLALTVRINACNEKKCLEQSKVKLDVP
jgi:DsbC/DsbD-like thiol-disulfide interchange protein